MKKLFGSKEILIFAPLLLFSFFIMFGSFQITPQGDLKLALKLWSDFAATIPLIRSFSLGNNFPPEYPLFAGPPIRYHFLFYLFVGFLERIGLRLDWALNIPSAISFFLLMVVIYLLAKTVFKKRSIAVLSVVFFLFNGSLSFLEFFKTNPININTFKEIVTNTQFLSFGPFDGKIVSAFWSLNIYTNQRHLALGYAALIVIILLFYKFAKSPKKLTRYKTIILGLFIGLLPILHITSFLMVIITLGIFFAIYRNLRKKILTIGILVIILSLPQIIYMGLPQTRFPIFKPGYLIENINLISFLKYWLFNLGLTAITAPLGFYLAKKEKRKIFLPFFVFFILANIFQFSPSMIDNHKFLNASVIGANILTSYLLVFIWEKRYLKVIVPFALFFLTLSGIIDFFPIVNDGFYIIPDIPKNKSAAFILANTPPSSVFLNSNFLYDPASIAGRKIYLGWTYFPWSLGYNIDERQSALKQAFNSNDKTVICNFVMKEGIGYIEVEKPPGLDYVYYDYNFFNANFLPIYKEESDYTIYDVEKSCNEIFPLRPR